MSKIYKWISYNRFTVITPVIAIIIWLAAFGCSGTTPDPTGSGNQLNTTELQTSFEVWKKTQEIMAIKFEAAAHDLQEQEAQWSKIQELIMKLASGTVATWPGLVQLLVAGGALGAITDNIRKRGVISGLKRNDFGG